MNWCRGLTLIFFLFVYFDGSALQQPDSIFYTLYLVGDAGLVSTGQQQTFAIIRSQLEESGENSGIIFLGDNIYPQGLPPANGKYRKPSQAAIDAQIELVNGYEGNIFFIPGNHDWAQGRQKGIYNLLRQEQYVNAAFEEVVFMPSSGCPGPVEVDINDQITLIIIDTQWFLHRWERPGPEDGICETANGFEVFQMLENMIHQNRLQNKKVIIASHHPMFTYGAHGGYVNPSAFYKPPVLGALHPIFRRFFGSIQDNRHPRYRAMKNAMVSILEKYPNIIHVAGHDHALEYSYKDSVHYIVSGSASKVSYTKKGKGYGEYVESAHGFARIDFRADGTVDVKYIKPTASDPEGVVSFEKELMKEPYEPPEEMVFNVDFVLDDSVINVNASDQYAVSNFKQKLLGENYRKAWAAELEVPVFDIEKEHGGLDIVQRGGGMQTKSLRLEAEGGKQYVLRSIEKYPENAIPPALRSAFAIDVVQDQMSASHPYGAFVIPPLAEAAGIYHTNPKLVYIPDDPRFGFHQEDFANTLALYEERPAKDWSGTDIFGNSSNIESTAKVLDELQEDNDHSIDQRFVLKSRLFDIIIGDWDRHDDQWRWSELDKEGKGHLYRPIPRDRDQAFFVNEGIFPKIWSRRWAIPKFEGFDKKVRWTPGLMYNARYFDRSFLTGLSEKEWLGVAREIKEGLADEAIENAIKQWPDTIYALDGEAVIEKLKARRDDIEKYADELYKFLAKEVDIAGSDKHELFEIDRLPGGNVHVVIHKATKEGEVKKVIYDREFVYGETKEIRLYGQGGKDRFEVKGEVDKSIKVRIVGGPDEDEIIDNSRVAGWGKKTFVYDNGSGNIVEWGNETKDKLSDDFGVNFYNRKAFKYNLLQPVVTAAYNVDDGVFLGAGFSYTNHGFRKEPFKSQHKVTAKYAFNTSSYQLKYSSRFTDLISSWDLFAKADLLVPNFTNNFFGIGNDTRFNENVENEEENINRSIDYYRLRFEEMAFNVGLVREIGPFANVGFGYNYYNWEVEDKDGKPRFVYEYEEANGLNLEDRTFNFTGANAFFEVDTRANPKLYTSGVQWFNEFKSLWGLNNNADNLFQFETSLSITHSFSISSRLTFATRVGYGVNIGDYPFFRAQTLGGLQEIRGFRRTRFYGDEKFFNNFEIRYKIFDFRTYLFPASFGILGFHDIGRVWVNNEDSNQWHRGFGGGIWATPFNLTSVSAEVGHSEEETLFYLRLGFLF